MGHRFASIYVKLGALPFILIGEIVIFQIGNPRFLSGPNVSNQLETGVYLLMIATGQMLVLLSGGFDLSVGANVALTSVTCATFMANNFAGGGTETNAMLIGAAVAVCVGLRSVSATGSGSLRSASTHSL